MKLTCASYTLLHLANAAAKPKSYELPLWNEVEPQNSNYRIIGGDEISRGSRPYLVPVVGRHFCGGSLISPSAVMTAAHCVVYPGEMRDDYEWKVCKCD